MNNLSNARSTIVARFWKYVVRSRGCWNWTGTMNGHGYGVLDTFRANRLSWIINRGDIPDGMFVLHRCDNPACVNPRHLFLGTQRDNLDDMTTKGRRACGSKVASPGESNPRAKLLVSDVIEIRRLQGITSSRKLATKYGLEKTAILRIWSGSSWRCV